jgi:hypothetical protein
MFGQRHDTQHNDNQNKGFYVTLSISGTQHKGHLT